MYRTKPICCTVGAVLKNTSKMFVEAGVSEAYTSAFCDIAETPLFNEFDAFKPHNSEPIALLNLCIVIGNAHPLVTQSHNLVHGRYLTPGGSPPTSLKQTSFTNKVN